MKQAVKRQANKSNSVKRPAKRSGEPLKRTRFKRVTKRQIQRVVNRIVAVLHPEKIILFGSYAYGKPNRDSDVDLFIVMESAERPTLRITHVLDVLHGVKDFPMDILVKTPTEMAKGLSIGDLFVREIVERGQLLYERKLTE